MKIYGIGTDIANINRIKKSLKNKDFIDRLFNKNEVKKCNNQINKANCYAKRFAAKEAFSKAIGLVYLIITFPNFSFIKYSTNKFFVF